MDPLLRAPGLVSKGFRFLCWKMVLVFVFNCQEQEFDWLRLEVRLFGITFLRWCIEKIKVIY